MGLLQMPLFTSARLGTRPESHTMTSQGGSGRGGPGRRPPRLHSGIRASLPPQNRSHNFDTSSIVPDCLLAY